MIRLLSLFALGLAALASPAPGLISAAGAQESQPAAVGYTCPMHPHYISDDPGACPICGMDLVRRETGPAGAGDAPGAGAPAVSVSPEMIQTLGVRLAQAEIQRFGAEIEAFAQISENERARTSVSTRVPGWVERLSVRAVGDEVTAGALLFEVYSPDLVAAQMDYFSASASNARRAETALRRLGSLGMGETALSLMRQRGAPLRAVPIYARTGGVVSELRVVEGDYLPIGADIMTLQDYGTVWLIAELAQDALARLSPGQSAQVRLVGGGDPLPGVIDYIYPTFDARTRTGRVRVELANEDGRLRPGGFADIIFWGEDEPRLAVPSRAVLYSQAGARVVVALGEGRFAPRAVQTGLTANGLTEIRSGLSQGETVVASGQFLIDSESRLNESFARMAGGGPALSQLDLSDTEFALVDHVIDAALYVHEAQRDGYATRPGFFDPAIEAAALMAERRPGRLGDIMAASIEALEVLKAPQSQAGALGALDDLTQGLRPWLMSRPARYDALGLTLYEAGGRAWLEAGPGAAFNPYGAGEAVAVAWPETPADPALSGAEPGAGMDHAGR